MQQSLNQGIYTMMSYNDGWVTAPHGVSTSATWGYQAGPMAFDIAALQLMYGANMSHRTGSDTYTLPGANQVGTFYSCIWDAGGTDQIVGAANRSNIIDLRAATLAAGPGGGGFVSYAAGIHGGFTIAKGAVIENAIGGGLNDTLIGNAAANILDGLAGNDTLAGAGGNDIYILATAGDTVVEGVGAGTDEVRAGYSYILGANVESLLLTGASAINGAGNALANRLTGNGAVNILKGFDGNDTLSGGGNNDVLTGRAGKDTFTGGSGADDFVFLATSESGSTATTCDIITGGFDRGSDDIVVSQIDAKAGGTDNAFVLDTNNSFSAGEIR